jgi:outer membrane protein insertion porin family
VRRLVTHFTTVAALTATALLAIACSGSPKKAPPPAPDTAQADKPRAPITDDELVSAKVAVVELRGLERIGETRARLALELRPGDSFDRARVRESLRKLMTIRGVADARAVAFRTADGAIGVAFAITETPRITAIEITGNKTLADGALLELAAMKVGEPLAPALAQRAALAMKVRYAEAGHPRTEVDWKTSDTGVVSFAVREGPRASISAIKFADAKALTEARLNKLLLEASAENTVGGIYLPSAFDLGVQHIIAAYYDIGHVDVKVGPHTVDTPTPETIEVTIPVEEGPKFLLGKLEVTGQLAGPAKKYLRQIKLRRGQVFSRSKIADAIKKLGEYHKARSKVENPVVTPLTNVDQDKRRIDIKFEIGT